MDAMTSHVASAPRTPTSEWHRSPITADATNSLSQVQSLLDRYGGNGSTYKGVPAVLKSVSGDAATQQKVDLKLEQTDAGFSAEHAATFPAPTSGAGALTAARLLAR